MVDWYVLRFYVLLMENWLKSQSYVIARLQHFRFMHDYTSHMPKIALLIFEKSSIINVWKGKFTFIFFFRRLGKTKVFLLSSFLNYKFHFWFLLTLPQSKKKTTATIFYCVGVLRNSLIKKNILRSPSDSLNSGFLCNPEFYYCDNWLSFKIT